MFEDGFLAETEEWEEVRDLQGETPDRDELSQMPGRGEMSETAASVEFEGTCILDASPRQIREWQLADPSLCGVG